MLNRARHIRSRQMTLVNATNCIIPNKNLVETLQSEIYQLENARLNLVSMRAEFIRLAQDLSNVVESLHCLSVSHWRAKNYWLEKYQTLKAFNITLSYPTLIFCKKKFFLGGIEQTGAKIPQIDNALVIKKEALIQAETDFNEKTRQYNKCIQAEIVSTEQETELVVATTELREVETEQMLLSPKKKNNTLLYVALAAGAFYFYTEDQKKKKKRR